MQNYLEIAATVPGLLIAVILHEIAHGLAARRLGDPTAGKAGRITLNPLKHIDPVMTILVPAILIGAGSPVVFGGAKPVPVNPLYFKNPRKGMCLVALAGPLTNFALALMSFALFQAAMAVLGGSPSLAAVFFAKTLAYSVLINLVLGIFNLIPIPPLDGGRIAVGLLPRRAALALARTERFGLLIVIALLLSGVLDSVLGPVIDLALRAL